MKIKYTKDPLLHKIELRRTPVIIRVNKFDEKKVLITTIITPELA